jgi:hypothetical protein
LQYLQLPLQLNINLSKPNVRLSHSFSIGGYIGGLFNYSQTTSYTGYVYAVSNTNKLKEQTLVNKNSEIALTGKFYTVYGDSTANFDYNIDKAYFNKIDFGSLLAYNIKYNIIPNLAIQLGIYGKYGFSQVDNTETITYTVKPNNTILGTTNIADQHYCRGNQNYSTSEGLRDTKSNNIATGIQLSFIYSFGNNNKPY